MQIGGAIATTAILPTQQSGNKLPPETTTNGTTQPKQPLIREIAESLDPKNMSYKESLDLANALMKAGEGDLSSAFLPPPLLKINSDGSVTNMAGTPEGDARMNNKFNMLETLTDRIKFNKSMNISTNLLEDAYSFLEKIQVARNTPSIDVYT
ncbi:MAG: hypothetical protein JXQ97_17090 [Natronospirillum sp.]